MGVSPERLRVMRQAVLENNVAKVRLLLKSGVPADGESDKSVFIALAATHGLEEVFELLLAHGANIRRADLLAWSVDGGGGRKRPSLAIVQKVLAVAQPNAATLAECLRYACVSGCSDVVRLLLSKGADPNGVDPKYHFFPLGNAVEKGHIEVVRVLLDAGADPTKLVIREEIPDLAPEDPTADTPSTTETLIETALRRGHPQIAELLAAHGGR